MLQGMEVVLAETLTHSKLVFMLLLGMQHAVPGDRGILVLFNAFRYRF
jgi:hypothetical protein